MNEEQEQNDEPNEQNDEPKADGHNATTHDEKRQLLRTERDGAIKTIKRAKNALDTLDDNLTDMRKRHIAEEVTIKMKIYKQQIQVEDNLKKQGHIEGRLEAMDSKLEPPQPKKRREEEKKETDELEFEEDWRKLQSRIGLRKLAHRNNC